MRGHRAHHEGRAVGGGLGGEVGAEVAARARAVVDDHGAGLSLTRSASARDDVQRAAGRVGHDQADGLARLGEGRVASAAAAGSGDHACAPCLSASEVKLSA